MTYKEFFAELAKLRRKDWELLADEMVRCNDCLDCPITAVAKAKGLLPDDKTCDDVDEAAEALGLEFSMEIVKAADWGWGRGYADVQRLRKRMLKAVGL
jgi:hypothetical protein